MPRLLSDNEMKGFVNSITASTLISVTDSLQAAGYSFTLMDEPIRYDCEGLEFKCTRSEYSCNAPHSCVVKFTK